VHLQNVSQKKTYSVLAVNLLALTNFYIAYTTSVL